MTGHDELHGHDENFDEHFDEVEAMRRFPSEAEWLDLPLPIAEPEAPESPDAKPDFVERTLQALRVDADLDRHLAELDEALPKAALQAFAAPTPSPQFVARCSAALQQDRRTRWQQMLARYVAPEPSPQFVTRTLAALTSHGEQPSGHDRKPGGLTRAARAGHRQQPASFTTHRTPLLRRAGFWPLLTAAAATVLWFAWPESGSHRGTPLELQLALGTPPALARAYTPSPMPAILASLAVHREPDALVRDGADGVWLLLEGE